MAFFFSVSSHRCFRSIEIGGRRVGGEAGTRDAGNYGAIENTFNNADRNCRAKGAKAPGRAGLPVTTTYNAHVASTRREVHLREKKEQPFSVAAAFVQSATRFLPSVLLNRPRARSSPEKGGGEFTGAAENPRREMYQPLSHDKRPGVGIIIYAKRSHDLRRLSVLKWIGISFFLSILDKRGPKQYYVKINSISRFDTCYFSNKFRDVFFLSI